MDRHDRRETRGQQRAGVGGVVDDAVLRTDEASAGLQGGREGGVGGHPHRRDLVPPRDEPVADLPRVRGVATDVPVDDAGREDDVHHVRFPRCCRSDEPGR